MAAEFLQRVDLVVCSDEDCEALHPFDPPMLTNRQYHLCAGVPEGGRGQCRVHISKAVKLLLFCVYFVNSCRVTLEALWCSTANKSALSRFHRSLVD